MNASCGPPFGAANFPSAPELARLPNVLPLPGMAMRDKDWWAAAITEVAGNLDALVRRTPYNHLVRNASTTGSVRSLISQEILSVLAQPRDESCANEAVNAQACATALEVACGVARQASLGNCFNCVSSSSTVQKLHAAHCTQTDIKQFCT